jgi:hypothetical protein
MFAKGNDIAIFLLAVALGAAATPDAPSGSVPASTDALRDLYGDPRVVARCANAEFCLQSLGPGWRYS